MPVPAQIRRILWNDYEMTDTALDRALTPGTCVRLDGLVGLDRVDHLVVEAGEVRRVALRCGTLKRRHGAMVGL